MGEDGSDGVGRVDGTDDAGSGDDSDGPGGPDGSNGAESIADGDEADAANPADAAEGMGGVAGAGDAGPDGEEGPESAAVPDGVEDVERARADAGTASGDRAAASADAGQRSQRGGFHTASILGLLAVAGLVLVTILTTLLGRRPTAHVAVVTEQVSVYVDPAKAKTSNLILSEARLTEGEDGAPYGVTNADLVFARSAEVRLTRTHPDTLQIFITASGGSIGTLKGQAFRTLDSIVSIRVPLHRSGAAPSFYFPFVAQGITVGNNPARPAGGQRLPVLRSGRVSISDITLSGTRFQAASRTLQLGDVLEVPTAERRSIGRGAGFMRVEGSTGMVLRYTRRNANASVTDLVDEEVLATTVIDRVTKDPAVGLAWVALLFIIIQPAASFFRDTLIHLFSSRYDEMRNRRSGVHRPRGG